MGQTISAKVVADSKDNKGNRITSVICILPRFILAELNTHRMFSRNSASSRAVPFKRMLNMVQKEPFIPMAWQKDHPGMQGTEYITDSNEVTCCITDWLKARDLAVQQAVYLSDLGVTKQVCNRLLEPFMWHTVLVTATEWSNFFELRCPIYKTVELNDTYTFKSRKDCLKYLKEHARTNNVPEIANLWEKESLLFWLDKNHGKAEAHMMLLAEAIWNAMNESTPKELKEGEWHIPFGDQIDWERLYGGEILYNRDEIHSSLPNLEMEAIKIATARCARTSYINYEGKDDYEADIKLYEKLLIDKHASPFEHCARMMNEVEYHTYIKGEIEYRPHESRVLVDPKSYGWCRNFRGFIQLRALIGE